jgi:hypothetical protein
MRNAMILLIVALCSVPAISMAKDLTADEQAFFDKNISAVVKITPSRLDDPAMDKVFAAPFYEVTIEVKGGDGSTTTYKLMVARVGSGLASQDRPSSDADLPDFQKMIKPDFKLKIDDDAKTFQQALDAAYPIVGDDDKKAEAFQHTGNQWVFIRGVFFNKHLGYVVQTNDDGTIASVKFSLEIP